MFIIHTIRRIDFTLTSGCVNVRNSSYRLEMGHSGLGPLRAALFPFLFYDGMFGGGSNNAAADPQVLVVAATALLLQFGFGGGSDGTATAVWFWWWQ